MKMGTTTKDYLIKLSEENSGLERIIKSILNDCEISAKQGNRFCSVYIGANSKEIQDVLDILINVHNLEVEITSKFDYSTQLEINW